MKRVLAIASMLVGMLLVAPAFAFSGSVEFPELFNYDAQKNTNLETALHSISFSFNEKSVPVTQELLAAIVATLVKEVKIVEFLPREEIWDYGMGEGCSNPYSNGCKEDGIGYYEGGVDYKGRGYIQLTLKSNYEKYCPDCVGTSAPELDVCGCKNQRYCTVTDETICPQAKALQPERAARIFASYYLESPSGKDLVFLSNAERYWEVAHAINSDNKYDSEFETYAKQYLKLFRNNPDKTEKLLASLNSGTMAAVEAVSIGFPVTLTLYVHEGDANGPIISGVQVTGEDGAGHSFEQTTNSDGYATITGIPGTWSFSLSARGYKTNSWPQQIAETDTKNAFLHKSEDSKETGDQDELYPEGEDEGSLYQKGLSLFDQGEYDDAIKYLDKVILLDQDQFYVVGALQVKGIALDLLGKYDEAIKCFDKAIEIDPQAGHVWDSKSSTLANLGKYDEAIVAIDKAIEIAIERDSKSGEVYLWSSKGYILHEQGKYDEAIECFDHDIELILEQLPDSFTIWPWISKARSLYELKRYEESLEACEEALRLEQEDNLAWAWFNKGKALQALGRTGEADAVFEKAKELGYEE